MKTRTRVQVNNYAQEYFKKGVNEDNCKAPTPFVRLIPKIITTYIKEFIIKNGRPYKMQQSTKDELINKVQLLFLQEKSQPPQPPIDNKWISKFYNRNKENVHLCNKYRDDTEHREKEKKRDKEYRDANKDKKKENKQLK